MKNQGLQLDVFRELLAEAGVIGQLAKDQKSFDAAYEAFRSGDANAYRAVLDRLRLIPRCHLICEWIRLKECVFLCLELCGPPKPIDRTPNPRELAEAIVRITADEKLVRELAEAVEKRNHAAFEHIVAGQRLEPICHLFCHWICIVRYRLLCRFFCNPVRTEERPNLATELRAAGLAFRHLLENNHVFNEAVAASNAGDPDKLGTIISAAGLLPYCHFICEWFCSWRCTIVCLTFCREFLVKKIENEITEAHEFAVAVEHLASRPAEFERLSSSVGTGDAKTFAAIIEELRLQRFCIQLCHWICALHCRRFCVLVCPPPDTIPLFTHVGQYRVDPMWGDFQTDGTTTGGKYAFTRTIPLIGIMPDGTAAQAYEYHFQFAQYTKLVPPTLGAVTDVDTTMIPPTQIGELEYWYWNAGLSTWLVASAPYWVNQTDLAKQTVSIPQMSGLPLVVSVNKVVKVGGWVEVPRENNLVMGGEGRFIPEGGLANLNTTKLTNSPFDLKVPAPGLHAGDAVPVAKEAPKPVFKIFFEARIIGGAPVSSNNLDRIAMSNTAYTYTQHKEWAGGDVTNKSVCTLDIAELIAPGATGCDRLHGHVHGLFTGYHPYLQDVSLWFEGNAIPASLPTAGAPFKPLPAGTFEATNAPGGKDFDISGLLPCAYIFWMSTTVGLTEGWGLIPDATDLDHIAFCVR